MMRDRSVGPQSGYRRYQAQRLYEYPGRFRVIISQHIQQEKIGCMQNPCAVYAKVKRVRRVLSAFAPRCLVWRITTAGTGLRKKRSVLNGQEANALMIHKLNNQGQAPRPFGSQMASNVMRTILDKPRLIRKNMGPYQPAITAAIAVLHYKLTHLLKNPKISVA